MPLIRSQRLYSLRQNGRSPRAGARGEGAVRLGWRRAKGGVVHGETDDFSYNVVKNPVHVRDFHATVLHLLGFDHERFSYKHQGLDQRLTGVEPAKVVKELLA